RLPDLGRREQAVSREGPRAGLPASRGDERDGAGPHARGRRRRDRHAGHRVRRDRPMSSDGNIVHPEPGKAVLPEHVRQEIDRWVAKFPEGRQRSAVIAALHAVQHENGGYLTQPLMDAVAEYLNLPPIQVYEVASFYSMFETKPVGRHHVSICTNISCMLRGAEELVAHAERKLGIKTGQSTPDGRIYLKCEEECLAACVGAPMMMVDHVYHENLTPEKVDDILDSLE